MKLSIEVQNIEKVSKALEDVAKNIERSGNLVAKPLLSLSARLRSTLRDALARMSRLGD